MSVLTLHENKANKDINNIISNNSNSGNDN